MIYTPKSAPKSAPKIRNLDQISQNLLSAQNLKSGFYSTFSWGYKPQTRFGMTASEICSEICIYSTISTSWSRFQISDFLTLRVGSLPPAARRLTIYPWTFLFAQFGRTHQTTAASTAKHRAAVALHHQ